MAKRSLKRYEAKRDFTKTPEPSGRKPAKKAAKKRLAFCVQKHLATQLHYDFRLEHNGVLLSWAVPRGPSLNTKDKRLAMRVEDHPYDYRQFEGVIPTGYGAGVVMLWDEGTWTPEPGFENVDLALKKGELKFTLEGVKLHGGFVLVRTGPATETGEREQWLLIKHRDKWAGDVDVAARFPKSVKSDRNFTEILAKDPEVWESHKAQEGDVQASLQKIVAKVIKLEGAAQEVTAPKRRVQSRRK